MEDWRAVVAGKAEAPLTIGTVDLEGPRQREVLVEVMATGVRGGRGTSPPACC